MATTATTTATATTTRNRIPDIKPIQETGSDNWLIRFSWKNKKLKLSLGKGKSAYAYGVTLSERIKSDIALGNFQGDLSQYRSNPSVKSPQTGDKPVDKGINPIEVLEAYLEHLESIGSSGSHLSQYKALKNNLQREGLAWFTGKLARYKTLLTTAYSWKKLECPDLSDFPSKKKENESDITEDIFSKEEISRILKWFEESYEYSHYSNFVRFRFLTGCRPSEAIGLLWEDIDLENNRVTIKRSHTAKDGLKGRKNKQVTYLPLNESLRALLDAQRGLHSEIVFPSPTGTFINVQNFDRRAWKSCKEGTGINKRFYAIRHTVLSHLVQDQGLATAAYVAGHKSLEMVNRHYGKLLSVPVLPEF